MIAAQCPSGKGRRIKLLGTDLIFGGIENIFVYPFLDVQRFENALRQTLSFWPIVTGRIIQENEDEYYIHCSDQSIPVTYLESDQLQSWPDLPVVVDDMNILKPFIDSVQYKPEVEPLVRFKITRLIHSDEYVLGVSFCHLLGDADTCLHFLHDLSRIYQGLESLIPLPIFQRDLFSKEQTIDLTLKPIETLIEYTQTKEFVLERIKREQNETDPIHLSFSSEQLHQIHQRIENPTEVTIHDAFCAYIIVSLNKYFFSPDRSIRRTHVLVNYRGVSETVSPKGHATNSLIQILTDDFPDPMSLTSIAKTIRQAIENIRNEDLLEKWIFTADILKRQHDKEGKVNFSLKSDEVILNSNYKYDWTNEVNFGWNNQCRFHTYGLFKFYCRIFRLNPKKGIRDCHGLEIAFRMPKGIDQEKFLFEIKNDLLKKS